ncbi:Pre-mRNA-splicing factor SPF27 [Echinococcus granulosus]|nr:Pre-mRNA-splicing factor SPF27 [Echinococcus granulosus]
MEPSIITRAFILARTMDQQNVVVDALPYFDKGYGESGMQEANALLTEEMRRYRPTKNYLENFPSLAGPISTKFETELVRTEFDRLANRLPMELMSMKRYELPPPPSAKMGDLRSWQEAIENAHAQLEHQLTRINNLELMSEYGSTAWKSYNEELERILRKHEKDLLEMRRKVQEINWQRKQEQMVAGETLTQLEEEWVSLVGKNYEIEQAILDLEQELEVSAHPSLSEDAKEP